MQSGGDIGKKTKSKLNLFNDEIYCCLKIRVITKLPNTEQSVKGKGKTHKSTNRQNQSTTGKLAKSQ
jgi:hypothetical protein